MYREWKKQNSKKTIVYEFGNDDAERYSKMK